MLWDEEEIRLELRYSQIVYACRYHLITGEKEEPDTHVRQSRSEHKKPSMGEAESTEHRRVMASDKQF